VATVDEDAAPAADVILVDRVGVLADLYALADVAFVGGGFHGFGLHSVLEPAAYGVPVVFGPEWQGSRDASGLVSLGGARPAGAAPELAATVALWFTDDDARSEAGTASVAFVKSGLGAAARSVELVKNLLH
jgi:3-deoxy-D-manno-octulosonic-acid transferase